MGNPYPPTCPTHPRPTLGLRWGVGGRGWGQGGETGTPHTQPLRYPVRRRAAAEPAAAGYFAAAAGCSGPVGNPPRGPRGPWRVGPIRVPLTLGGAGSGRLRKAALPIYPPIDLVLHGRGAPKLPRFQLIHTA